MKVDEIILNKSSWRTFQNVLTNKALEQTESSLVYTKHQGILSKIYYSFHHASESDKIIFHAKIIVIQMDMLNRQHNSSSRLGPWLTISFLRDIVAYKIPKPKIITWVTTTSTHMCVYVNSFKWQWLRQSQFKICWALHSCLIFAPRFLQSC